VAVRDLYDRVLGAPFVYDHVRPLVVGGIDYSTVYGGAETTSDDVVLDVGCGTGDALRYLTTFRRYVGFDIDDRAVALARRRYAERPGVQFEARRMSESDVADLEPTVVVLMGLLHHLADEEAIGLLRTVGTADTVRRVIALDTVFLQGEPVSNFLARLDRGRECRTQSGYEKLARDAGWTVEESAIIRSHPTRGLARYVVMTLRP
jgi:SAM-dependent methyltransferase